MFRPKWVLAHRSPKCEVVAKMLRIGYVFIAVAAVPAMAQDWYKTVSYYGACNRDYPGQTVYSFGDNRDFRPSPEASCLAANTLNASDWAFTAVFDPTDMAPSIYGVAPPPGGTCQYWHKATGTLNPQNRANVHHICIPIASTIVGPFSTKARPAGGPLPQVVKVSAVDGTPLSDATVILSTTSGGALVGRTNVGGEFKFMYTPPNRALSDKITANCNGCQSPAEKTISVEAPLTCPAEPGGSFGNPINAAIGEKIETVVDWEDQGPHPLTFVRQFRSFGNVDAGLGRNWTHNFSGTATIVGTDPPQEARIHLGGSETAIFRYAPSGQWVPDNGADQLVTSSSGATYTRSSDESQWIFDPTGKLVEIRGRNGWSMQLTYSGARLTRVTNAFGRHLLFTYDAQDLLSSVSTPDGQVISFSFDSANRLSVARNFDGTSHSYAYEAGPTSPLLTGIFDELGIRIATYGYDADGRATSTQHADGAQAYRITWPQLGRTASLIAGTQGDPNDFFADVQVTDPLGNRQTYTYQGGDGTVSLVGAGSAAEGGTVKSREVSLGLPVSETDFLGVKTLFAWDTGRKLNLAVTEASNRPESRTTQIEWNSSFRLPSVVTETGRTTTYGYDGVGNVLTRTITDTTTGAKRVTSFTYGSNNLPATMTDPKGGIWTFGYDGAGNRTSITDPIGRTTAYTFDGAGRVITKIDAAGVTSGFNYDLRGRLLAETDAGGTTTYSYVPTGQLESMTLPTGYQVSFFYDAAQRLIAISDSRGVTVSYAIDGKGNRIREEVKDAAGAVALAIDREIDRFNRVISVRAASGARTSYGYDANGSLIGVSDPLGHTVQQTFDGLRRITATTVSDNASAHQAWNALDQLTQLTDAKAVATTYTYNAFGEVLTETSPDIGTIRYTRDANGDVIATEDAKGQVTQIERDPLGRPTVMHYADGALASFAYDAAGRVIRIEDKSGVTAYERDAQGRITSRTQDVNDVAGSPSRFRIGYSYTAGDLTGITYPSGLKVTYKRANGRITGIDVQEPGGSAKKPKPVVGFVTGLTHTALGQPKAWFWFNGDGASRTFDADGRMTGNEFASYMYDAASRITGITQQLWMELANPDGSVSLGTTSLNWQVGYDTRDRLTSFVRDGAETRYSYDANSNRLTALDKVTSDTDLDGEFEATDFNKATGHSLNIEATSNRLLGFSQTLSTTNTNGKTKTTTSSVSYALDANGSLTSDGLRDFFYAADGRLAKVRAMKDGEAATISYLTNALGQRVFKGEPVAEQTLPNEATLGTDFVTWLKKQFGWMFTQAAASTSIGTGYVYGDGAVPGWALLGEYDNGSASGKGRSEYIWLPTEDGSAIPVGIYRNGNFFAIHTDHLGTPRVMTNEAKRPVWQWPYSAFGTGKPSGVLKATPNPKAAITNKPVLLKATAATEMNLRFPGQYFDQEAGTVQNYFRDYDAAHGRYRQADPIGLFGGGNRYAYVAGDGVGSFDSFGLSRNRAQPPATTTYTNIQVSNLIRELGNYNYSYSSVSRPGAPYTTADVAGLQATLRLLQSLQTCRAYGVNAPPVRIEGKWTPRDLIDGLKGRPPKSLGRPDLHHADQMPGSAIHEVLPGMHRGNRDLHPNRRNQGVTDDMRAGDRQLHWWYRAQEQGALTRFPEMVYD